MSFAVAPGRQDAITIPTLWVAIAVSIVLHALFLWSWHGIAPKLLSPNEDPLEGKKKGSLAVKLVQPPRPPVAQPQPSQPEQRLTRPAAPQKPAPSSPVLTQERQTQQRAPAIPPPQKPAAAPSASGDFASLVEARRNAREAQERAEGRPAAPQLEALPAETDKERHSREVAISLGLNRGDAQGAARAPGGGIFQVIAINPDHATVAFYGWNRTIEKRILQTIEIPRGNESTIERAVVRRMIELIRTQATGDITWESLRLRKDVQLSARPKDSAQLEAFLMEEFFWDKKQRR